MLYLLRRTDDIGYDEYVGFIVRASSDKEAREFVIKSKPGSDENDETWRNPAFSTCTEIQASGEEKIILSSFNAG